MRFETLKTERLTLRRLRTEDAEILANYRNLPDIARFQKSYTVTKAHALIQEMAKSDPSEKGKWFQFAIELTGNRLIGDIGFLNTDENRKNWVGFTLVPEYWHCGYAAEAVHAVLKYYSGLGISSIWASTDPENFASMKLLKTLGFALVESKSDDVLFCRET